jgi:flagellar motor switch protein FliN/FliY
MRSDAARPVQEIRLAEADAAAGSGRPVTDSNFDLIRDVRVRLTVSAGECEITVKELFALKANAVLSLNKETSEPVDVLLDGKVVARGNLVAVGDSFGVQIIEILHK